MEVVVVDHLGRQMSVHEHDARTIVSQFAEFCLQPSNPEGPDPQTYLMDLITKALEKSVRESKTHNTLDELLGE